MTKRYLVGMGLAVLLICSSVIFLSKKNQNIAEETVTAQVPDKQYEIAGVTYNEDPYEWDSTKEFMETKGCYKEKEDTTDTSEKNIIKRETWKSEEGSLVLLWYDDGEVAALSASASY